MEPTIEIAITNPLRAAVAQSVVDFVTNTDSYVSGYVDEGLFGTTEYPSVSEAIVSQGVDRIIVVDYAATPMP